MIHEEIIVANVKCSGCAATISSKVGKLPGVEKVIVDPDADSVVVDYSREEDRGEIIRTLKKLGYPEATEENGLLLQVKSYASCMIGRLK